MNRLLLALYPRGWRERYGAEVAGLAEELISAGETTPLRAGLDLAAGAFIERWRALARRAVLRPAAAVISAAAGIALAVSHTLHGAGAGRPYFDAHHGWTFLIVVLGWILMELAKFVRGRQSRHWREGAARAGQRSFWLAAGICAIATNVMLYMAPPVIPAAAIRPGAAAFAVGMVVLLAGMGLLGWSFRALGDRYVSFAVVVSPDQPVVTAGPYRVLRHPGHAGFLLACTGVGVTSANWVALAALTLLPLAVIIWRIRVEENALLATLGGRYRGYASGRKRLVPLVW